MSRSLYSACVEKIKSMPDSIVTNEFATADASVGGAQPRSIYLSQHPMTERVNARKRIFKDALECALCFRTAQDLCEFIADYTGQPQLKRSDRLLSIIVELKNTLDESKRAAGIQVIIDRLTELDHSFSGWSKRRITESGLFALLIKCDGVPGSAFARDVYIECQDAMGIQKSCLAHVDPNVGVLIPAGTTPNVRQKTLTTPAAQINERAYRASSTTQDDTAAGAVSVGTPAAEQAGAVLSPNADNIRSTFSVNEQRNALDLLSLYQAIKNNADNSASYLKRFYIDTSGEVLRLPSPLYDAVIAPQILYSDFSGVTKITYNPMPVNWREMRHEIILKTAEIIAQILTNFPTAQMAFNLKITDERCVYFNGSPFVAMLLARTNFENGRVVFEIPLKRTVENCFSYTCSNPEYSEMENEMLALLCDIQQQKEDERRRHTHTHTLFGGTAAAAVAQEDASTSIAPAA
jgi:hypothetical protein